MSKRRSKQPAHRCPTCGREFKSFRDFPQIRIVTFERLSIPETLDTMSEAAARKQLARRRKNPLDANVLANVGINMTPQIARACELPAMVGYLEQLATCAGRVLQPNELLPPFKPHELFKWAHPIRETKLFLSLDEGESASEKERAIEVRVHCAGPNMGSAGGPTLQLLGVIARLKYQGLLVENL